MIKNNRCSQFISELSWPLLPKVEAVSLGDVKYVATDEMDRITRYSASVNFKTGKTRMSSFRRSGD